MDQPPLSGPPWRRRAALAILLAGLALPGNAGADPGQLAAPAGCGISNGWSVAVRPSLVRSDAARPAAPRRPGLVPAAEPPPALRHAFYSCTVQPTLAVPVGAGWLAVGPVLRS